MCLVHFELHCLLIVEFSHLCIFCKHVLQKKEKNVFPIKKICIQIKLRPKGWKNIIEVKSQGEFSHGWQAASSKPVRRGAEQNIVLGEDGGAWYRIGWGIGLTL